MAYEYAVLSCIGGDDGNGSGVLLTYGQTDAFDKVTALGNYYRQFGGYVVHESLFVNDDGSANDQGTTTNLSRV